MHSGLTLHPELSVLKLEINLGSVICYKIELLKNRSQIRHDRTIKRG